MERDLKPAERDDSATLIRVLLVDDDETARKQVAILLSDSFPSVTVREVTDHVGFYRALQRMEFDIVITELSLYWGAGIEVASAIRALRPSIPVIMFSASDEPDAARAAVDAGLSAYVAKADDPRTTLMPAIRSALQLVEAEEKVASLKERVNDVLDSLNIAVFRSTFDGHLAEANNAFLRLLGLQSLEEARSLDLPTVYKRSEERTALMQRLREDGQVRDFRVELVRSDGSNLWVALTETVLGSDSGEAYIEGVAVDVTAQHEVQEALRRANEQYRAIFETVSAPTAIIDDGDAVSLVNSAFEELSGFSKAEVEQCRLWTEFVADDDIEWVRGVHRELRERPQGTPRTCEFRFKNRQGQTLEVRASEALLPGTTRIVASLLNLDTSRKMEKQLLHDAFHDSLTGLPNRYHLLDRLHDLVARSSSEPSSPHYALLLLDLDRFKVVNDSLGHTIGDEMLKEVAQRLVDADVPADTVARFSGDTFALIVHPLKRPREAGWAAEKVRQILARPLFIKGHRVPSSASIGIVLGSQENDPERFLRDAEAAMYRAKERGRDRCEQFEPAQVEQATQLLRIENELLRALEGDELVLHYQPIVALAAAVDNDGASSHTVVGFDVFLRWQHPEAGLLYPCDFLQVAEDTGLIIPLGKWALATACHQLRQWQEQDPSLPTLFVSSLMTAPQLAYPELYQETARIVVESGVAPSSVLLTLTEATLVSNSSSAEILDRLTSFGLQLGIESFGMGRSALDQLHRFPLTTLRTARSFLSDIGDSEARWRIVDSLQSLGRGLGMRVVVGGIGDRSQLGRLSAMGVEYGQGSLFSPPVDATDATRLLESGALIAR